MRQFCRRLYLSFFTWTWSETEQASSLRLTSFGRARATVWPNGTWHTWGKDGAGGENDKEVDISDAKREAFHALERQGWV